MKSKLVIVLMFMMWFSAPAVAQEKEQQKYHVCEGTFALCTTAQCSFGTSHDQNVDCVCTVNKGHSAGGKECKDPIQTDQGTKISSRFFPIGSYQACPEAPTDSTPWAWCLDKECFIDKDNPTIANCQCGRVATAVYEGQASYPYIIVTGQAHLNLCKDKINYSSATILDVTSINDAFNAYLRKNNPHRLSTPTALQSK